jgi:ribosomal protein L37AE/L43A
MERIIENQTYAVVACTKCGKLTYAPISQKARQCPVCRRRFPVAGVEPLAMFGSPTEATRFIAGEDAKKAGRMDFAPVTGFAPASARQITRPRTEKACGSLPKTAEKLAAWVKRYFSQLGDVPAGGVPTMQVTAAASKAGFASASILIKQLVSNGILKCPKPYTVDVTTRSN